MRMTWRSWAAAIVVIGTTAGACRLIRTPRLAPLAPEEQTRAAELRRHVETLAGFGPRSTVRYTGLQQAEAYIAAELRDAGYSPAEQVFMAGGREVRNIEAELTGSARPETIVVVGAHYDTISGSPGANDNASGVAAMLELARLFARSPRDATVRFVAFVNEEPPYFLGDQMGSLVYARRAKGRGERITAMYSLETIGYYSDVPGSQQYPAPFHLLFPATGNFIAMVSNFASAPLLQRTVNAFSGGTTLRVIGSPAPERIPGVGWSDHWSFWQQGYPAVMVTDTAPYRYPHYHSADDTPDKLDYARMARVVSGMARVIERVAR